MKRTITQSPDYIKLYYEILALGRSIESCHFYAAYMTKDLFKGTQACGLGAMLMLEELQQECLSDEYINHFKSEILRVDHKFFYGVNRILFPPDSIAFSIRHTTYSILDSYFIARQNNVQGIPLYSLELNVESKYRESLQLDRSSRERKMQEAVKEFNSILPHHADCQIKTIDFNAFYQSQI